MCTGEMAGVKLYADKMIAQGPLLVQILPRQRSKIVAASRVQDENSAFPEYKIIKW